MWIKQLIESCLWSSQFDLRRPFENVWRGQEEPHKKHIYIMNKITHHKKLDHPLEPCMTFLKNVTWTCWLIPWKKQNNCIESHGGGWSAFIFLTIIIKGYSCSHAQWVLFKTIPHRHFSAPLINLSEGIFWSMIKSYWVCRYQAKNMVSA